MQKRRMVFLLLAVLSLAALLTGCGSSSEEKLPPATGVVSSVTGTPVGINNCTTCHTAQTADWMKSRHANAENGLSSVGTPTIGAMAIAACKACHDRLTDSARLAGFTGNERPVVGCEDCHGGGANHNGSGFVGLTTMTGTVIGGATSSLQVSGQFLTCSRCHELLDQADPLSTAATTSSAHDTGGIDPRVVPLGTNANVNSITDTHFAKTGSWPTPTNTNLLAISGYAMDYNSEKVCSDCHNPHGTADINRDWAVSLHADVNRGHAWALYNFSCDGTDPVTCGTSTLLSTGVAANNNRWLCQPCHTTTGIAAIAEALESGNTALAGNYWAGTASALTFTSGWKPETLRCNGCHRDNRGTMRNPGAFKAVYSYWPAVSTASGPAFDPVGYPPQIDVYARATFQYPDLSISNVCVICHSGRNSGSAVHNLNTDPTMTTVDFSNLRFGDGHRFTSAATMFKALGYEYAGRSYENAPTFMHDKIGSSAAPNTGTKGPCVGCHMDQPGRSANHLSQAVGKTGAVISNISSEACFHCHQNSSAGLAKIADDGRLAYAAGRNALTFFLGPNSQTGLPYAFTLTATNPHTTTVNWLSPGDSDTSGNTTGKNNLGAMFNSRYLSMERGAYIHNSTYVKRLIYDSIDWLDDNQMNFSVGVLLTSSTLSTTPSVTNAIPYLLQNGSKPGSPSERP